MPVVDAISAAAQAILVEPAPLGGALVEETALLTRWLHQPGVRIVRAESGYASPLGAAGRLGPWAATARSARVAARQWDTHDAELDRHVTPVLAPSRLRASG